MAKHRVLLVDDHPIFRYGLRLLLNGEDDLAVCGEAETARDCLSAVRELMPDALMIDISLGGHNGLELIKAIRGQDLRMPILVVSMHDEKVYAERALRAGANGYTMKQAAPEQIIEALRRVLQKEIVVSKQVLALLMQRLIDAGAAHDREPAVDQLSDRELEVLDWFGRGLTPVEVAERLSLSVKTIESHWAHMRAKLGMESSAELEDFAVHWLESEGRAPQREAPRARNTRPGTRPRRR